MNVGVNVAGTSMVVVAHNVRHVGIAKFLSAHSWVSGINQICSVGAHPKSGPVTGERNPPISDFYLHPFSNRSEPPSDISYKLVNVGPFTCVFVQEMLILTDNGNRLARLV